MLIGFVFSDILARTLTPIFRKIGSVSFKVKTQISYIYVRNLCNLAIAIIGQFDGECVVKHLVSDYVLDQQIKIAFVVANEF